MSRRVLQVAAASALLLAQSVVPVFAAEDSQLNFKVYGSSDAQSSSSGSGGTMEPSADTSGESSDSLWTDHKPAESTDSAASSSSSSSSSSTSGDSSTPASTESARSETSSSSSSEVTTSPDGTPRLQGYIRVVPSGTKVPIIMDSAVDSDTSQEGDEFAARTSEDLNIDGSTIVPAGSVIKGRIAQINAPRHLSRSGSVALKFDTVTTPDNRQIPLSANLVARGGVVHAKRGLKDIAIDTGTVMLPTVLGVGIGAVAGGANSSSSLGTGGGALIGAAVGAAVGVIVLCAKKGKRVDVRPGDELKIELAEDLRMPM